MWSRVFSVSKNTNIKLYAVWSQVSNHQTYATEAVLVISED